MITNNFSFFGALGNAQNIAASKFLSVPNTIDVPPKYSIDTDVPSVAEFLTCSFDGRLWLFRRSRRFYLAVLKWDEDTQRLIFVTSVILSNENLIMRGIDWILTDKSFILSSDDEPFFSRIEYNADDASYFNAILRSYSFFPELETWQQIVNEQVIHIEGSTSDLWKVIPQNKLTPIEFHYYSDDNILAVTNFYPKLCYCNGLFYAKGKAHIGRVFLLPRSFNENGDIEDFYLYISPDYKRVYDSENHTFDDNDGWDNLILASLTENSACFFTPDNHDYGFCKKALNAHVTSLPLLETLDFSDNNGAIFFDGLTQSNLLLNDTGASLLYDNISYECNQLRLWLAPAGDVKTVNSNFVCDSNDNFSLINHLDSGFFREKINSQSLPVSFSPYSQKFFSMGHFSHNNKQYISINEAPALYKNNQYALWDNIFKSFLHISVLYVIPVNGLEVFGSDFFLLGDISYIKYHEYVVTKIMTDETFTGEYIYRFSDGAHIAIRDSRTYRLAFREAAIYENSFCDEIGVNLTYLNIDNGSLHSSDFSLSLPQPDVLTYEFDGTMSYGLYGGGDGYPCHFSDQHISSLEFFPVPSSGYISNVLSVIGNSIFSEVITESYSHEINLHSDYGELSNSTSRYEKVADLPDNGWRLLDDSIQCYLKLTGYLKLAGFNGQYLVFSEQRGNVNFFLNISQTLQPFPLLYNQDDLWVTFFNIYNLRDVLTDNYGKKYILTCTHICQLNNYYLDSYFIVLRSEYNPNIFDFESEIERSKLF